MAGKVIIEYKEIDRLISDGVDIKEDVIDVDTQARIIKQVDDEYIASFRFNEAKRAVNLARLRLYNNQRRESKALGDPLMFTVFNTVLANLYDDRLSAIWQGRGGSGDEDIEENLNILAEYDYEIMQKSELDYFWDWDTNFFGRGLVLMMEFDRKKGIMAPVPEVMDASTWIRDPKATSVNGDMRGKGAMRFGGREMGASYWELKNLPGYFNLLALRKVKDTPRSLTDESRDARASAQGTTPFYPDEENLGKFDNYEFKLLDWFTTIKGQKYLITLGNGRKSLHRMIKLDKYNGRWPIVDRTLYPMSRDWDGVSIPDLTEDKQRGRAVLLNIGMESAKSEVTPAYLYDQTRIKNKNDLNWRINKFVAVDGRVDNAIAPINKSTAHQYSNLIMDILQDSAQNATAATELRQGNVSGKDRTLGEQELAAAGGDKRFSMSTRIYGWSERAFWRLWYLGYKKHIKDKIDEKVIRLSGALAPEWRELKRDNIIATIDPDVKIESTIIAEGKRIRQQQNFGVFLAIALADPETQVSGRRYLLKKAAKLQGMNKEEIGLAFPPTVDELQAEFENELLNKQKVPTISIQDDHLVHIEIHAKANQNAQSVAHILAHKKQMVLKRNRPDLFPPREGLNVKTPGGGTGTQAAPPETSDVAQQ